MAVHYTGGGGGLLGTLMRGAAMFVPGLQPFAPYIGAASALAKGDIGGAVTSAAAPMVGKAIGNVFDKAGTATPGVNDSLNNSLWAGQRTQFQPPDNMDYVNMRMEGMKGNVNRALDVAGQLPTAETSSYAPNESLLQALGRNMPRWDTDPVTGQPNKFKHPWGWR